MLPEAKRLAKKDKPEDVISEVFRLHTTGSFERFAHDDRVLDEVARVLGADELDVFLSQFIFKNPGAYGQPWHQDSYYFPFEPDHQLGVWLAVTQATLENGCLGSVEIVDHDMTGAVPVLMSPGDVLLFDSHLMHRSTDNESSGVRAAMVWHHSSAGTIDRTEGSPVNEWVPARRLAPA